MANELGYFVSITFALIMVMFVIDLSMDKVAESEGFDRGTRFMDYETSQMRQFDKSGNYTLTDNVLGAIPEAQVNKNVQDDQGTIFSDIFGSIRTWLEQATGLNYIINIVNTLPNFLKLIFFGELQPLAFAIGYIWFGLFVLAIIFWLKGGSN